VRGVDELGKLAGKRVLVRADLNVPLANGEISDDGRIRASLPTVRGLCAQGARVVVCSHLGRPNGAANPRYSLRHVAARLAKLLDRPVAFATDVVGPSAQETVAGLADGDVALLENLRFEPGEASNDPIFAKALAGLADAYVDDAFGAVHRAHASVTGVPGLLPHAAGSLVLAEVEMLRRLTETPDRPYAVVLGGSKVSDKLGVIGHLLDSVDCLLVGGGMCFTFLRAQGHDVGDSLLEVDQLDTVRDLLAAAADRGVKLALPVDIVVAREVSADAETTVVPATAIPPGWKGLDIGPATAARFAEVLADARTVFWNGPMGVFELAPFAAGTAEVGRAVAAVDGTSIVGGGDSAAAVRALNLPAEQFTYISTGGGASLEYLEGKPLPGLAALES
jgi:phosphoglycerate kinase